MKTEWSTLDPLLLGGVCFYGDPLSARGSWDSENEIGKTWKRYTDFMAAHPVRSYSLNKGRMYEVHLYGDETPSKGYFEVFVGEEVRTAELPPALCAKYIPGSDYLKVTLSGGEITADWWKELDAVLWERNLKRNDRYLIQAYDDRFKGMDRMEESEMEVYLPILSDRP